MSTILPMDENDYESVIKSFAVEFLIKSADAGVEYDEFLLNQCIEYRDSMLLKIAAHFDISLEKVAVDYQHWLDYVVEIEQEMQA